MATNIRPRSRRVRLVLAIALGLTMLTVLGGSVMGDKLAKVLPGTQEILIASESDNSGG